MSSQWLAYVAQSTVTTLSLQWAYGKVSPNRGRSNLGCFQSPRFVDQIASLAVDRRQTEGRSFRASLFGMLHVIRRFFCLWVPSGTPTCSAYLFLGLF